MTSTPDISTILLTVAAILAALFVIWLIVRIIKSRHEEKPPAEMPVAEQMQPPPSAPTIDETVVEERGPPLAVELAESVLGPDLLDRPEPAATRMERLRSRLARSGSIGKALLSVLSRADLTEADWEEIEDTLLLADVGLPAAEKIMSELRSQVKVAGTSDPARTRQILRDELLKLTGPDMDRSLAIDVADSEPAAILVVGVNGTGKTTTVGKLGRLLTAEDKTVLMGAADTFRAAAAEQLTTWGGRVGVEVVKSDREGSDPAAVAFETVARAKEDGIDVVIVDTAGRLQTKTALMDELGKVKRVMEKQAPVSEVLLVLDATTGQNGMRQAEVFAEAVGVTGIVLTKLDGSAKGGIVISVQQELGVPVKFVGLGEGPDDLAPFDPEAFVDAIIGDQ